MNPLQLTPLNDNGLSSQAPYFNDYQSAIEKNHYAVLFKPSYPVQSRELTQLQYILQNQVNALSSYVFKNGSLVLGSASHQLCDVLVIDQTDAANAGLVPSELIGRKIKNINSDTQAIFNIADARILPILIGNSVENRICLFVTNISPFANNTTTIQADATFNIPATEDYIAASGKVELVKTEKALVAHVDSSIFFYDGYFLRTDPQSSVVFTINEQIGASFDISNISAKVGLFVAKDIATIGTDVSLGDPAAGASNFGGPGADRLIINLGLGILPWDGLPSTTPDDNFIELFRFKNGINVANTEKPQNGPILDLFAQQVSEINGSFTVKPFCIKFTSEEQAVSSSIEKPEKFNLLVEKGTAYNNGYRVDKTTTTIFEGDNAIAKARTFTGVEGADVSVPASRYAYVTMTEFYDNLDPTIKPIVNLYYNNDKIGSARFTGLAYEKTEDDTKIYRCYLDNVTLDSGAPFSSVTSITHGGNQIFNPTSPVALLGAGDYVAIAKITDSPIVNTGNDTISDVQYYAQRVAVAVAQTSTENYKFSDDTGYGIFGVSGNAPASAILSNFIFVEKDTVANTTTDITDLVINLQGITGGSNSRIVEATFGLNRTFNTSNKIIYVYFKVNVEQSLDNPVFRSKYLKLNCLIGVASTNPADVDQFTLPDSGIVNLKIPDVYRIRKIVATKLTPPVDVTSLFTLDNGQTDTMYDYAKIRLTGDYKRFAGLANGESISAAFGGKLKIYADVFQWDARTNESGMFTPASYIWSTGIGEGSPRSTQQDFVLINDKNITKRGNETQPWFGNYSQEDVPQYTSSISGKTYLLDRCFDFRQRVPVQVNFVMTPDNLIGTTGKEHCHRITPNSIFAENASLESSLSPGGMTDIINVSYKYYLPRVDTVILTKDNDINVIQGIPSAMPVPPAIPENSLSLWDINIPAYTPEPVASHITGEYIDNQRLTFREIRNLSTRIDRIEKSIALDQLEAKLVNERIMDPANPQTEMAKLGIFSDKFADFILADNYNPAYSATIDTSSKTLRPGVNIQNINLQPSASGSVLAFPEQTLANRVYRELSQAGASIALFDNRFVMLTPDSEESVFVYQTLASETINLNPFAVFAWQGNITVKPAIDNWVDTNSTITTIGSTGLTIFGQNWQDWASTLSGQTAISGNISGVDPTTGVTWNNVHATTTITDSGAHRALAPDGVWRQRLSVGRGLSGSGSRINTNFIAYLRPRPLFLSATGLKPNTRMYVFFDNVDITASCIKRDSSISRWSDSADNILLTTQVTGNAIGNEIAKTDEAGNFEVAFNIPSSTFLSGTRNIIITSNSSGATDIGDSFATGNFEAQGISTTQETFVIDPTIVEEVTWRDPIAQSFLVSSAQNPNGIALSSIDLFFKSKDDTIPVIIEIRPSVNGYPNNTVTIASSRIVVYPADINVGTNADGTPVATTMHFDAPVFLPPGEYHIIARSNSNSYTVWTAVTGAVDSTGKRITSQPYAGTFFKSANNSTWIADGSRTLSFVLRRYTWNKQANLAASTIKFQNAELTEVSSIFVDTMFVKAEIINFGSPKFDITWSYAGVNMGYTPDVSPIIFSPNENVDVLNRKLINANSKLSVFASLRTTSADLSPVIDISQLSLTAIENIIADATNAASEITATPISTDSRQFRYITKQISLANGFEASSIRVDMQLMLPPYYTIKVFVRALGTHDSSNTFAQRTWQQLVPTAQIFPVYDNRTFRDVSFIPPIDPDNPDLGMQYDGSGLIKTFAIKIVITANELVTNMANRATPPLIKNLRGVALL